MKQNFKKIFQLGTTISICVVVISFFIQLIPCIKISDSVKKFGFCTLPSIFKDLNEPLESTYFGLSNNPLSGFVFEFILVFVIFLILYSLSKRKPKKVLDLTK